MKRFQLCLLLIILVSFSACTKKQVYIVDSVAPPRIEAGIASQESFGYPPILRPKGKRQTIRPGSQYFTLAIPNAIDMSGRAQDLQRSLADMLYTELFSTGRFNLLDRGELVDLDPQWLASALKKSLTGLTDYSEIEKEKKITDTNVEKTTSTFDKTFEYLDRKNKRQKELDLKLSKADGILLVYITSRVGGKKGGHFSVDYRIVNRRHKKYGKDERDEGDQRDIVLFAGSKSVRYISSTIQEIDYNRDDIIDIAHMIVKIFPHPKEVKNAHVIKRDQMIIAIDRGRDQQLIPGMIGYVVYSEDSIRVEEYEKTRHYSYLGEFIITEVFDKSSTGVLLKPYYINYNNEYEWDVNVGDAVVIK